MYYYKICFVSDFLVKMIKQDNFLNVIGLQSFREVYDSNYLAYVL